MKIDKDIFLGKKILIYGLGKTGVSTFKFLKKKADVYLFDDNKKTNLKIITINQVLKIKFDIIIISPGIDISNCKLSKFLNINLDKIYTDLDVFYSFYKNTSIAITGTNGKSTTAKILFDILTDQKNDVRLIGNIGNPALSEKKISKKTFFVIEVSSYQLEYSKIFSAKFAVILNISIDHIERHKNLTNYVNAKFKLINSQNNKSFAFVKKNDRLINQKIRKNKFKPKIYKVDTLNMNKLSNQLNNKYFISDGNKENLSFILKIASKLKLNKTKLFKTLNNFKGLKYRQQIIFDNKNLTIINDSKSTSFASSENILKNFNDIYWILGGIPKKGDKFKLTKNKCRNFKVFTFGDHHKQFNRILRNKIKIKKSKNLKETLKKIFFEIKKQKIKKNTIFFSPAGASFDSFKNFEDRGKYFDQLIKKFVNAN
ncbi:UDP-N-acetylmuramoyl-L-alanine--D-glutamate ligase [Candidatus Pelagibacter bacterium]|nr:UDP-N-acetylmuramoyl-L-alanine--D-glutamate ligase [Candidatus Pelagibacter bacterium]